MSHGIVGFMLNWVRGIKSALDSYQCLQSSIGPDMAGLQQIGRNKIFEPRRLIFDFRPIPIKEMA